MKIFIIHRINFIIYFPGPTSDESSYVIGNYKSDTLSSNLMNLDQIKLHLNHQIDDDDNKSPRDKKDVKNLLLSSSKNLLGKVLSPTKDKGIPQFPQQSVMTTQQQQQQQQNSNKNNNNDESVANTQSSLNQNNVITTNSNASTTNSTEKPILMTRRQLTDPFASDEEDEDSTQNQENQKNLKNSNETSLKNSQKMPTLDPSKANVCTKY